MTVEDNKCDCGCGRQWLDIYEYRSGECVFIRSLVVKGSTKQCIYLGPLSEKSK